MQKKFLPNKRRKTVWRTLWQLRYRFYGILVVLVLVPVLYSSTGNIPQSIDAFGYTTVQSGILADKIVKETKEAKNEPPPKFASPQPVDNPNNANNPNVDWDGDKLNRELNEQLKKSNYNLGKITPIMDAEGQPIDQKNAKDKSLNDLVPKPNNAQRTSFLRYPRFNINAPVIYSTFDDLFAKKADCQPSPDNFECIDFRTPKDTADTESPVQLKLRQGPVHMAFSPLPGEIGNSYIVGHSSNYSWIKSNYNKVFAPMEKVSSVGDEFTIYDQDGRELKFSVFEVKQIAEEDTKTAYQNYGEERRIVTLQTSILTTNLRTGIQMPTHRWLTRGELIMR